MDKTIGFIRLSTDEQDVDRQRLNILELARKKNLRIDDWVEMTLSGRKVPVEKRMAQVIERVKDADTVVVSELSRFGRSSTGEIFTILHKLAKDHQIRVVSHTPDLDVAPGDEADIQTETLIFAFGLAARIEGMLISQRTKDALAAKKAKGIPLGKPKGTIQASKFDEHREKIEELLRLGVSVRKIAKVHLGLGSHNGLNEYIKKRKLPARVEVEPQNN
jgi:DNA invertase Pin-like site-specific DNA recombinase